MGHTLNEWYTPGLRLFASRIVLGTLVACAPSTGSVSGPFDNDGSATQHPPGDVPPMGVDGAAGDGEDTFAYTIAEITMREGLSGISQRYIEPVDLKEVALGGLRGLTTIDPSLSLELSANGKQLVRSEEHTSELQSHHDIVCRPLLEKKK